MTISRSAAETVEAIRRKVRRKLGDPAATADGTEIPEEIRKYSDIDIDDALNDTLKYMGNEMALNDLGEALIWTTLTYVEGANLDGCLLPSGVNANAIIKVEDRSTDTYVPYRLSYVSPLEIEQYGSTNDVGIAGAPSVRRYTLTADPATTGYKLVIRPAPSGRTFRIYHLAAPLTTSSGSDVPLFSDRWVEYIAVATAIRLYSTVDDAPVQLAALFQKLDDQFTKHCQRQRGPERIRLARLRTT